MTYYITSKTCATDQTWHATKAKTLHGAKVAASRMYQATSGGSIEIGIKRDQFSFDTVAIKHGHTAWINYI